MIGKNNRNALPGKLEDIPKRRDRHPLAPWDHDRLIRYPSGINDAAAVGMTSRNLSVRNIVEIKPLISQFPRHAAKIRTVKPLLRIVYRHHRQMTRVVPRVIRPDIMHGKI